MCSHIQQTCISLSNISLAPLRESTVRESTGTHIDPGFENYVLVEEVVRYYVQDFVDTDFLIGILNTFPNFKLPDCPGKLWNFQ